jgi:hypothetical protein
MLFLFLGYLIYALACIDGNTVVVLHPEILKRHEYVTLIIQQREVGKWHAIVVQRNSREIHRVEPFP